MSSLIVAIDPGVNGGIVWSVNGDPVECAKMPGSDIEVCQLLADLSCKAKDAELFLEEPPLFAGKNIPGSAIGKLMWNTGVLYGAAVAMGWKIHRIRPAIWQKAHTRGTKGDLTTTQSDLSFLSSPKRFCGPCLNCAPATAQSHSPAVQLYLDAGFFN